MRRIIITSILVVVLALVGTEAALKSSVGKCIGDAQACMNKDLAWPDFLDNAIKRVVV